MAARRRFRQAGFAIFAAYLLVLQALFAGVALGAAAAGPQVDPFTQVLCAPAGVDANGIAPEPAGHPGLPKCCSTSCVMVGGSLAPPPALELAPVRPASGRVWSGAVTTAAASGSAVRSPRSTRAPPFAA